MPSSQDLYNQMVGVQNQLKTYTPVQQQDVYNDLLGRVDNFRPQYQELSNLQTQAYAEPARALQEYQTQFGDSPSAGPSALTRLSSMLGNIGRIYGTADTAANVLNQQGGRLQDLAGTVLNQYNQGRQALTDQYNMITPLYQTALQKEEAEKQRRAQEAAVAEQRRQFDLQQKRIADAERKAADEAAKLKAADDAEKKTFATAGKHGETRTTPQGVVKVWDQNSQAWMSQDAFLKSQPGKPTFDTVGYSLSPGNLVNNARDVYQDLSKRGGVGQFLAGGMGKLFGW